MKIGTVQHFGTPDLPDPCTGAHLDLKFETVQHFGHPIRQIFVVVPIWEYVSTIPRFRFPILAMKTEIGMVNMRYAF